MLKSKVSSDLHFENLSTSGVTVLERGINHLEREDYITLPLVILTTVTESISGYKY